MTYLDGSSGNMSVVMTQQMTTPVTVARARVVLRRANPVIFLNDYWLIIIYISSA